MIRGKTISLIIPCRNEEVAIAALLKRVPRYVDEVLVIDNRSKDKTPIVAKRMGARVIRETRQVGGIGYGFAHQRGMKEFKSDYLITMDGDGTYPIADIRRVIETMIKRKLDFVSCNRFPLKHAEVISNWRRLGVWILNNEVKWLYGYPMKDILSGMWAMSRETAQKLHLIEGGWNLSPEIKLAAYMHPKVKFAELHIDHEYREGQSKQQIWTTGFDHLFYILNRRLTVDNPAWLMTQKVWAVLRTNWELATSLAFE